MKPELTQKKKIEKAILVGVITPNQDKVAAKEALDELALLTDTAGGIEVERIVQNLPKVNSATYIGTGKVEELQQAVEFHEADLVVFDDDLSPAQLRNLERTVECKVMDRSGLILDIFAGRAKSATAKTQVELAQLEYMLTRLTRMWTHLSRQKGGIGTKGPGETQIETDRRLIRRRVSVLKERLTKIDQQRETQRKRRKDQFRISLVGYTNAGKSTLMNAVSGADLFAEDRLFATLDSTTRAIQLTPKMPALLSDTVGFIRKLPHGLIESFKSTLDEVRESDLLLHVVDIRHVMYEDHVQVVNNTLHEIGAGDIPVLMVFNKVDQLEEKGLLQQLTEEYKDVVFVSALRGIGLEELNKKILEMVDRTRTDQTFCIPVRDYSIIARIHQVANVIEEVYTQGFTADQNDNIEPVAKITFSVEDKLKSELERLLQPYEAWQAVETEEAE